MSEEPVWANLVSLVRFIQSKQEKPLQKDYQKAERPTLIVDLDQTLVFTTPNQLLIDQEPTEYEDANGQLAYIYKRPYVEHFLKRMVEKFNIIVFTASMANYAEFVVNLLDPTKQYISEIYSRSSCTSIMNFYIKDLTTLELDLSQVVILDDSLLSFSFQVDNGVLIEPWRGQEDDLVMLRLVPFFNELAEQEDIRVMLRERCSNYSQVHSKVT